MPSPPFWRRGFVGWPHHLPASAMWVPHTGMGLPCCCSQPFGHHLHFPSSITHRLLLCADQGSHPPSPPAPMGAACPAPQRGACENLRMETFHHMSWVSFYFVVLFFPPPVTAAFSALCGWGGRGGGLLSISRRHHGCMGCTWEWVAQGLGDTVGWG